MSHIARLDGIRDLLRSYAGISKPAVPDAQYAERYVAPAGMPIVLEPRGKRHTNIWVRANSLSIAELTDLNSTFHPNASEGKLKPNHDLYPDPLLRKVDLICFKVTTVSDARRIVDAIVRAGVAP